MPQFREDETFVQVVRFEVEPANQAALIRVIVGEIERWICKLEGFESATVHSSPDGVHVLNYAQWSSQARFQDFARHAESENLGTALHSVPLIGGPHAVAYRVVRSIDAYCPDDDGEKSR